MESWQSLVYCIGLENRRIVMFREFKSHTFLHSHDTYGTPLYHRIDYLRVFYSAGIHRVDWVTIQDTRIIFPPVGLG